MLSQPEGSFTLLHDLDSRVAPSSQARVNAVLIANTRQPEPVQVSKLRECHLLRLQLPPHLRLRIPVHRQIDPP